ncbi:MAG TPA: response regulator [Pseudolabrys sp.]|nr:response regulator [Pseudolabrys sp.]
MHSPPRILIVDDNETNRDILQTRLSLHGYDLKQAADGEEALAAAREHLPDLILLDIMMPKIDGIEVCKRLKGDASLPFMPIILTTAKADSKDVVQGLEAGADEYLTKPIDQVALVARVKSVLRLKALHDQVTAQAAELADLNRGLEQRVSDQLGEIERMSRLRRFLPPQVADLIVSSGMENQLESHRREITALFCDLRGFTGFSESADPEDVMALLRDYHAAIGAIVHKHGGTLERYAGDGVMVIFNAPVPVPEPALSAVKMALEMRAALSVLIDKWRRLGHDLGFGIGISHGYATLGTIGFEGRFDYAAIGTVSNVASRLCDEAQPGQILISPRVLLAVEKEVACEPAGEFELKGLRRPMAVHNVVELLGLKP